jgi:hypothetical protein
MFYVAVDVGCIECGEYSNVLGIFTTESKAQEVVDDHCNRQKDNWCGEHSFKVFEVEQIDEIKRVEYKW